MSDYVLVSGDRVIAGPRPWARFFFESILRDDLDIVYSLPNSKTDLEPIEIAQDVRILPVELIEQPYNPKIEYLHGPFWNFANNVATGTYEIRENELEAIKNALKRQTAINRWIKESRGVTVTIQNTEVTVDTSRGNRDIFIQKLLLMPDGTTVRWKFPECWLTLTKSDLQTAVTAGAVYVEQQFAWESAKVIEIDACTTAQELDAIDLGNPYG